MASANTTTAGKLKRGDKIMNGSVNPGYEVVSKVEFSGKNVRVTTNLGAKVYNRSDMVILV